MTSSRMRLAALVFLALSLPACSDTGQQQAVNPRARQTGPIAVGVVSMHPQTTPKLMQLPGRVVASATADVRPQVNGIVQEISFQEGSPVKAGDVLYKLDNKPYVAARAASAANVKKAQASVAGAQSAFDRTQKLVDTHTASSQSLDDARSALLQAQAAQEAAEADLQAADINLGYTVIKAPISGLIGTSAVSVGSLVTANQTTAMATINTIQPIYVDLVDSSANLLEIRDQVAKGVLGVESQNGRPAAPKVSLTLETGQPYDETGRIINTNPTVSETTGTFTVRTSFDNTKQLLLPGMYARANVDLGNINGVFLVPQLAVSRDAAGKATAYVVSADSKAEVKTLTTDGTTATDWIVTSGLNDGDKVIVDGFTKLSDGAQVTPTEVQIDDKGVVDQQLGPGAKAGGAGGGGKSPSATQKSSSAAPAGGDTPSATRTAQAAGQSDATGSVKP